MKRINLLTINGVLFLLFGLLLLVFPGWFADIYGTSLKGFGIAIARFWGIATLSVAVLFLMATTTPESLARRAVVFCGATVNGGYAIGYFVLVVRGSVNLLAWSNVVLHLVLSLLFLFRYIMGPATYQGDRDV